MRPTPGLQITAQNLPDVLTDAKARGYLAQRKLNGDRVTLAVDENLSTLVQNRHGGWYQFNVENRQQFTQFGKLSLFDGEVYEKNFYPFEVLAMNAVSLVRTPVEARVEAAKRCSQQLGAPWMYNVDEEYLAGEFAVARLVKVPRWEGIVLKKLGSPYVFLPSDAKNSPTWSKRKWTL
jgi:hypothetical protein